MSSLKTIAADLRLAAECLHDARLLSRHRSRNAPYLASQAAEHLVRAVATSERLHIERSKAHLIDTNARALPDANPDKKEFLDISALESYATTYRYPTAFGRIVPTPSADELGDKLDRIGALLDRLLQHFGVDAQGNEPALTAEPRRLTPKPSD